MAVCLAVAAATPAAAQTLPAPWATGDIGSPSVAGSASVSSGTFTVAGAGTDIWGTSDQFRFVYQPLQGDVDVRARVTALQTMDVWSKAGVMIRSSLAANASHASMFVSAARDYAFQRRSTTGGSSLHTAGPAGTAPGWVRLVRSGNVLTAYHSTNGTTWTTVGSQTITMGTTIYVGLAVTSHHPSSTSTATFTNVTATGAGGLPAPWTSGDIGSPALAGSATAAGGTFTVTGAGSDIWNTSDQFRFVYQPVQGDTEIVARVASLQGPHTYSKAGVMIRAALTGPSQNAFVGATRSAGWTVQHRHTSGATSTTNEPKPAGAAPGWVRLVREGSLFSGYYSPDGSSWTLLGSQNVTMGSTVYVGLAVTSVNVGATATATFTNVTVRTPGGGNQSPTVSITSPASGATFTAPASISIAAAASDSDGTVTRVDFYRGSTLIASDTTSPFSATWNNPAAGSYSLTAVAMDNGGGSTTSAPVAVSVNASGNQLPSVSITSPASGSAFNAGATVSIAATASDPDGTIAAVDFYRGSTLIRSDTTSPYTASWTNAAAGTYSLTAVARDNSGGTQTSAAVSVTVNSAGNQAPAVSLTSPSAGATFTAPATITLAATASDSDGTVGKVDFFRGATLIGTDTASPYSVTWSGAAAGSYTLTAVATDDDGATRTSASVAITVSSTPNQLPNVSITAPASGAGFTAPANIAVSATASDPDGSIAGVDFYAGSQLIGTDTASPYSATWSNVPVGTYTITAIARDNRGASRTSANVTVSVAVATLPTRVVFNPSPDNDTGVTSYSVAIRRASDPLTATPVATRDLGKPAVVNNEISVDISTLVNPLPAGSYYAVVSAIGVGGSSASTPSATFVK
jgi:regulation of enolase protein 1 (concanavalin A-like superfamily)